MNSIMNIVACLLLVITFLSGCSSNNPTSAGNSSAPEETAPASSIETITPEKSKEANVDDTEIDLQEQVIYLWEEGNIPATTIYPENGDYFDPPDFLPNMEYFPVKEGADVKGAVLICAGGAFQVRSDGEGAPVAEGLNELGYQCFVVNYRLRPYTQEEGALDLARAVRFVRSHAEDYGIDEVDIAVIGFSAGGILCGEMLLNYDGLVDGTVLDPNYVPDELDKVSADASAADGDSATADAPLSGESNILIAYFTVPESDGVDTVARASRIVTDGELLGNHQYIAGLIQQSIGGDMFTIETVQVYPARPDLMDLAADEKSQNARPELSNQIENLENYDVIFLGYPNWNADLPMPLYTFLEEYDFSGKTIIPFVVHGGSGFSNTIRTIADLQPNATVITDGLSISRDSMANAEDDVRDWVQSFGLTNE